MDFQDNLKLLSFIFPLFGGSVTSRTHNIDINSPLEVGKLVSIQGKLLIYNCLQQTQH